MAGSWLPLDDFSCFFSLARSYSFLQFLRCFARVWPVGVFSVQRRLFVSLLRPTLCFSIWQIKTWETCKLKLQKLANYNSHDLIQFLLPWFALHELAKMKPCGCLLNFPFQFRWKNSILPRSLKWNKTQVHRHMKNYLGTCCMAIPRANACYIFVSICN